MNSSNNLLNTPENQKDFYVVISFAAIMFALSCLGSLYVLYRTSFRILSNLGLDVIFWHQFFPLERKYRLNSQNLIFVASEKGQACAIFDV